MIIVAALETWFLVTLRTQWWF